MWYHVLSVSFSYIKSINKVGLFTHKSLRHVLTGFEKWNSTIRFYSVQRFLGSREKRPVQIAVHIKLFIRKLSTHQKIAEISVWVGRRIRPFSFTHDVFFVSLTDKMRLLVFPSCKANVSSVFTVSVYHTFQNCKSGLLLRSLLFQENTVLLRLRDNVQ